MRLVIRAVLSSAICLVLSSAVSAIPVPALNLDDLIGKADVIVIGAVEGISEQGRTLRDAGGTSIAGRQFVAEILVDHVLKGPFLTSVRVQFVIPDSTMGYERITPSAYCMFFLKRRGGNYEFVSPYYPSVSAVPVSSIQGSTAAEKVVDAIGAVVRSPGVQSNIRRSAIVALSTIKDAKTQGLLHDVLADSDDAVRLTAASYLLIANDIAGLSMVENALLYSTGELPDGVLITLRYGLSHGLSTETAIPSLSRILTSEDAETRRAATEALRHIGSTATTRALARALDDADFHTRYVAVVALAEISGDKSWRPSPEEFKLSEARYLEYWRQKASPRH